nr:hypothetical protein [uncultured Actinoplanes sp.]
MDRAADPAWQSIRICRAPLIPDAGYDDRRMRCHATASTDVAPLDGLIAE